MSRPLETWNDKSLAPTQAAPGGITHVTLSITQDDGRTTSSEFDFPAVASCFEEDCEAAHADHGGHANARADHADHVDHAAASDGDASGWPGSFDLGGPFEPLTPSFVVFQPLCCPSLEPVAWPHDFWDQTTASTLACGHEPSHGDAGADSAALRAFGDIGADGWL